MESAEILNPRKETIQAVSTWLKKFGWSWTCLLRFRWRLYTTPILAQEKLEAWISEVDAAEGGNDFRWVATLERNGRGRATFYVLVGGLRNRPNGVPGGWIRKWNGLGGNYAGIRPYKASDVLTILDNAAKADKLSFDYELPPNSPALPTAQLEEIRQMLEEKEKEEQMHWWEFHIHGAVTSERDGLGFAWVRLDEDEQDAEWIEGKTGLTPKQVKYRALTFALDRVPEGRRVRLFTDSRSIFERFNGVMSYDDYGEYMDARELIGKRNLEIQVKRISKEKNRARKVLDRYLID